MNMQEIILKRIHRTLAPPEPPPIFVAEIRYPDQTRHELIHLGNMTPEDLTRYLQSHLSMEQQVQALKMLARARQDVDSPCGLRLVVLFQRDDQGAWSVDDIRFMDPLELGAFLMRSGRMTAIPVGTGGKPPTPPYPYTRYSTGATVSN